MESFTSNITLILEICCLPTVSSTGTAFNVVLCLLPNVRAGRRPCTYTIQNNSFCFSNQGLALWWLRLISEFNCTHFCAVLVALSDKRGVCSAIVELAAEICFLLSENFTRSHSMSNHSWEVAGDCPYSPKLATANILSFHWRGFREIFSLEEGEREEKMAAILCLIFFLDLLWHLLFLLSPMAKNLAGFFTSGSRNILQNIHWDLLKLCGTGE